MRPKRRTSQHTRIHTAEMLTHTRHCHCLTVIITVSTVLTTVHTDPQNNRGPLMLRHDRRDSISPHHVTETRHHNQQPATSVLHHFIVPPSSQSSITQRHGTGVLLTRPSPDNNRRSYRHQQRRRRPYLHAPPPQRRPDVRHIIYHEPVQPVWMSDSREEEMPEQWKPAPQTPELTDRSDVVVPHTEHETLAEHARPASISDKQALSSVEDISPGDHTADGNKAHVPPPPQLNYANLILQDDQVTKIPTTLPQSQHSPARNVSDYKTDKEPLPQETSDIDVPEYLHYDDEDDAASKQTDKHELLPYDDYYESFGDVYHYEYYYDDVDYDKEQQVSHDIGKAEKTQTSSTEVSTIKSETVSVFDDASHISSLIKAQLKDNSYDIQLPILNALGKNTDDPQITLEPKTLRTDTTTTTTTAATTTTKNQHHSTTIIPATEVNIQQVTNATETHSTRAQVKSSETVDVESSSNTLATPANMFLFSNFPKFSTTRTSTVEKVKETAPKQSSSKTTKKITTIITLPIDETEKHQQSNKSTSIPPGSNLESNYTRSTVQLTKERTTPYPVSLSRQNRPETSTTGGAKVLEAHERERETARKNEENLSLAEIREMIQPYTLSEIIVESEEDPRLFLSSSHTSSEVMELTKRLDARKNEFDDSSKAEETTAIKQAQATKPTQKQEASNITAATATTTVETTKQPATNPSAIEHTKAAVVKVKVPLGFLMPEPEIIETDNLVEMLKQTARKSDNDTVKNIKKFPWEKPRELPKNIKLARKKNSHNTPIKQNDRKTSTTTRAPVEPLAPQENRRKTKKAFSLVEILQEKGLTLPEFLASGGSVKQLLMEHNKEVNQRSDNIRSLISTTPTVAPPKQHLETNTDTTTTINISSKSDKPELEPNAELGEKIPKKIFSLAEILRKKNMTLKEFIKAGHSVEKTLQQYNGVGWRERASESGRSKTTSNEDSSITSTTTSVAVISSISSKHSTSSDKHTTLSVPQITTTSSPDMSNSRATSSSTVTAPAVLPTLKSLLGEGGGHNIRHSDIRRINYRTNNSSSSGRGGTGRLFGRHHVHRTRLQHPDDPSSKSSAGPHRYNVDMSLLNTDFQYTGERFDEDSTSSDDWLQVISRETDEVWQQHVHQSETNSPRPVDGTSFDTEQLDNDPERTMTSAVIASAAVAGCGLCFFVGVLVMCRWHQRRHIHTDRPSAAAAAMAGGNSDCSSSCPLDTPAVLSLGRFVNKPYSRHKKTAGFWGSLRRTLNQRYNTAGVSPSYVHNTYGSQRT